MRSDYTEKTDKFVSFMAGSDVTLWAALQSAKDMLECCVSPAANVPWVKNVQVFASFVLTMELASCG